MLTSTQINLTLNGPLLGIVAVVLCLALVGLISDMAFLIRIVRRGAYKRTP